MAKKNSSKKDANYDFAKQKEPSRRMGASSFANMPDRPIMKAFDRSYDYRSGILNNEVCGIEELSGIEENYRD